MKEILVMGVGNLVLCDEGVGIHAVDSLQKENLPPWVDLLDGGTGGIALICLLQEYKRVILIDATLDGNAPGTIRHIKPHYSQDYPPLLSAHEIGLKEMIEAMMVQEQIPDIDLIAVSVVNVKKIGLHLSPDVARAIPLIGEKVRELINTHTKH